MLRRNEIRGRLWAQPDPALTVAVALRVCRQFIANRMQLFRGSYAPGSSCTGSRGNLDAPFQFFSQVMDEAKALFFQPKAFDPPVSEQVPFGHISMLKKTIPVPVMLAHSTDEWLYGVLYQVVISSGLAEREMKRLFVAVKVLIVKVRIFIEPHA